MRIRVLARCWVANSALTKLPHNTHFSGGILANTNRLDTVFEFLPTPVPVNHRHETIEGGGNGFGDAVFHPHTEPCWVFAFIGARGWSAHLFVPWANPGPTGSWGVAYRAQLGVQSSRKDSIVVSKQNFGGRSHLNSRYAQSYAYLRQTGLLGSGTAGGNITERNYPTFSRGGLLDSPDQKFQLIDSAWQDFYQCGGRRNAYQANDSRSQQRSRLGPIEPMCNRGS